MFFNACCYLWSESDDDNMTDKTQTIQAQMKSAKPNSNSGSHFLWFTKCASSPTIKDNNLKWYTVSIILTLSTWLLLACIRSVWQPFWETSWAKKKRKYACGWTDVMTTLTQLSSNLQNVHPSHTKKLLHVFASHPTKKGIRSQAVAFIQAFVFFFTNQTTYKCLPSAYQLYCHKNHGIY